MTISQVGLAHKGGHHQNTAKIPPTKTTKKYDIVKYGCKISVLAQPYVSPSNRQTHTHRHMPTTSTAR